MPREVVAWVDERIGATDRPDMHLLDASLCESNRGALIAALNAFGDAGGADPATVCRAVLAAIDAWYLLHPTVGRRVAHSLWEMAVGGEFPDRDAEYEMISIDSRYDLADQGILQFGSSRRCPARLSRTPPIPTILTGPPDSPESCRRPPSNQRALRLRASVPLC